MRSNVAPFIVGFLALAGVTFARAQGTCPPSGLSMSLTSTRLGDLSFLTILGTPAVAGLVGIDATGGPTSTPFGPVCLGLTPALQFMPFAADPLGVYSLPASIPPNPSLSGLAPFLQAAAFDPNQPSGFALSNGIHPVLRPPRLWIFTKGTNPTGMCVYDALADAPAPAVSLAGTFVHAVAVPVLDLVAVFVDNAPGPHVVVLDGSGGSVLDIPLNLAPMIPSSLVVRGTTLYVVSNYAGNSRIESYALPSGTPGSQVNLPFQPIKPVPVGPGKLYAAVGVNVIPIDMVNGTYGAPISLGAVPGTYAASVQFVRGGLAYCLVSGTGPLGSATPAGFTILDPATDSLLFPTPVLLPYAGFPTVPQPVFNVFGPGFLLVNGMSLIYVDPVTLASATVATSVATAGLLTTAISAGGTEFLTLNCGSGVCSSPGPVLKRVDLFTGALTPLSPLQPQFWQSNGLLTLPSTTLRKTYLVTSTNNLGNLPSSVIMIQTDPVVSVSAIVPLPISATQMFAVVD